MNTINKNKAILTALMLIFLASGNASAGFGKLKGKIKDAQKSVKTGLQSINAGDSPLHIAVRKGNVESMKEICSACGNNPEVVNYKNLNGETPLHLAFKYSTGKYEKFWMGPDYGDDGYMYIRLDPKNNKLNMVKYLVNEAKADVNIPFSGGISCLHYLIRDGYGMLNYSIMLLMAGANVNVVDNETGESVLEIMSKMNNNKRNKKYESLMMLFLYVGANKNHINAITNEKIDLSKYNDSYELTIKRWPDGEEEGIKVWLNDILSKETMNSINLHIFNSSINKI